MKLKCKAGTTSKKIRVFIQDSSVTTTESGLTGLTNASSGLIWYYFRDGDTSATSVSIVSATLGTYTSGGFKEVDATHMQGVYELGVPNAVLSVAGSAQMYLQGATNMVPIKIEFELDAVDYQDATAFGLSRIDAAISSRMATFTLPTNFSSLAITAGGAVTAGTVSDKTGYSLTQAFPTNFSSLVIDSSGTVIANISQTGTAQAGGASTITLASAASTTDSFYVGQRVWIRTGTGAGACRVITAYVGSTRVATVDRAWQTNPDNTSVYWVGAVDQPKTDSNLAVTAGTVSDKTGYSLTQAFPANFSTLAIDGSGRVTAGTVADKTGYSLTQAFPANFSSLAITAGGAVTAGTVSDKTGYSLTQSFPANFASLAIDGSGRVTVFDVGGRVLGGGSSAFVGAGVYALDGSGAALATASALSTLQTSVNNINNLSALATIAGPTSLEVPTSGSIDYVFIVLTKDVEGHLLDLASNPTISATNAAGTDRTGNLSAVTHLATGQYSFKYNVTSSAVEEGVYIKASGTASSDSTSRVAYASVAVISLDTASTLNAIKAKTDLIGTNSADSPNEATSQNNVSTLVTRLTATRASNLDHLDADISPINTTLTTTGVKVGSYASGQDPGTYLTNQGYTTARAPKLDNLDATVSSRLATTGYTAPANSNITAIKAKIDQLTFTYPNKVDATLPAGVGVGNGGGAWPVTIKVTSDGTTPIVGATVRISSNSINVYATSGNDGTVQFSLDVNTYTISATVQGYSFNPVQDLIDGSGHWVATGTTLKTITMSLMVSPTVPPSIRPGLSFPQIVSVFKNVGKLIYTAKLAQTNSQMYRQHLLQLNTQFANGQDVTDGGLSYNVFFNSDVGMQEMGVGVVANETSGILMVKTAMDTYLMQLGSSVGAKPNDTPNTIASLLAGNVAAATGYVQPSGGLDALSSFAAYFGQNYNVTLPQSLNANLLDAWITTTIV